MGESPERVFANHIYHRWADGIACWVCTAVAKHQLHGPCRPPRQYVSLSYVPRSRPCSIERARDRAEEGEL